MDGIDMAALVALTAEKPIGFYGVADNCFKLGRKVYEAIEDEDDGYRSMLDHVREVPKGDRPFFRTAIDKVRVVAAPAEDYMNDTWSLVGYDGHVWLTFGTNNYDDYYPCFVFTYTPKGAP